MDTTARKLIQKAFFLLLALFPLGQLVRIPLGSFAGRVVVQPLDLVAGFIAAIYLVVQRKEMRDKVINPHPFILAVVFSTLAAWGMYSAQSYLTGLLYLVRIIVYTVCYLAVRKYLSDSKTKDTILDALVTIGSVVSLLGLAQYFLQPDLRSIVAWGWDGHLYRLVGSFIDPAFTGIILVFSLIVAVLRYEKRHKNWYLISAFVTTFALLLTYSRASYLSFAVGVVGMLFFVKDRMKKILMTFLVFFILAIPLLPRPQGVGVRLERTDTIVYRANNYEETFAIWQRNPLLGVGFNMICAYKSEIVGIDNLGINSCGGADASLLLILATTGVVGMITFLYSITLIRDSLYKSPLVLITLASLLVHSLFNNSLFYPWVLIWIALLAGVSMEYKKE